MRYCSTLAIGTVTGRLVSIPSKVSLLAVGGVGVRQVKSVTAAQPKKLCKSAKYLSRVIMEAMGRSATDWIERCVIMDAKAQLSSTQKRISEISDDLNFASPSFFGKYFKRITGLSPRAFREAEKSIELAPFI